MTPEQQIKAIAELDGLKEWPTNINKEQKVWHKSQVEADTHYHVGMDVYDAIPKYLTSRDAIIPVIEKVINNSEIERVFNYALYDLLPREVSDVNAMTFVMAVKATPAQLSEALLRASGKWEE